MYRAFSLLALLLVGLCAVDAASNETPRECVMRTCAEEIGNCFGDAACATALQCAQDCKEGDVSCERACFSKSSSPVSIALVKCAEKCAPHTMAQITEETPRECVMRTCSEEIGNCFGDAACATALQCAQDCKEGDVSCERACFAKNPSAAGAALVKCAEKCAPHTLAAANPPPSAGAFHPVEVDEYVIMVAKKGLELLNQQSNSVYAFELHDTVPVVAAEAQVVAGIKYNIQVNVVLNGMPTRRWMTVWVRPWLNSDLQYTLLYHGTDKP